MNPSKLRGGDPPIDRQCRLCNRIGHFARSCTYYVRQDSADHVLEDDDRSEVSEEFQSPKAENNVNRVPSNEWLGRQVSNTCTPPVMSQQQQQQPIYRPAMPYPAPGMMIKNLTFPQNGFAPQVFYNPPAPRQNIQDERILSG